MSINQNTSSPRDAQWREELRKATPVKERTSIPRVKMPELPADYRVTCNEEVNQGFRPRRQCLRPVAVWTVPTRSVLPDVRSISTFPALSKI